MKSIFLGRNLARYAGIEVFIHTVMLRYPLMEQKVPENYQLDKIQAIRLDILMHFTTIP